LAAAAAIALTASSAASADTKTIYIGMNGGTMEKAYTQYVFPAFEKANNVKVVVVPGTSSDILAKARPTRTSHRCM
jgi:putative spermidine/putrescine transport system substrate-binding protein